MVFLHSPITGVKTFNWQSNLEQPASQSIFSYRLTQNVSEKQVSTSSPESISDQ